MLNCRLNLELLSSRFLYSPTTMTEGTANHNKIAGNLYARLNLALQQAPYEAYIIDRPLNIASREFSTYPDVMVVARSSSPGSLEPPSEPVLIAEVISHASAGYDRSSKFTAYRSMSSFQEYLIVDQYSMNVEHYLKNDSRSWIFMAYEHPSETIVLSSIGCRVTLAEIYSKIDFAADRLCAVMAAIEQL
jgi:Uma2 family endonuclease